MFSSALAVGLLTTANGAIRPRAAGHQQVLEELMTEIKPSQRLGSMKKDVICANGSIDQGYPGKAMPMPIRYQHQAVVLGTKALQQGWTNWLSPATGHPDQPTTQEVGQQRCGLCTHDRAAQEETMQADSGSNQAAGVAVRAITPSTARLNAPVLQPRERRHPRAE